MEMKLVLILGIIKVLINNCYILQPLAWSSDGLVEAVESKSNSSQILAVQWHPEILQDEESKMLLTRFLERVKTKINVGGI